MVNAYKRNPYIIGRPISDPEYFFGRDDIFLFIADNLKQGSKVILLHGQRRIGKSSVLCQIPNFFKQSEFNFIAFDLQDQGQLTLGCVLHNLANAIIEDLELSAEISQPPSIVDLEADPGLFSQLFLKQIFNNLSEEKNKLVILLDEFDVLENGQANIATNSFFPYLRQIIRQQEKLFIVPVIGRHLDELSNLLTIFKEAPSQQIGLLDKTCAEELITRPAEGLLEYSSNAISAILDLSSGHPYFTQVICHTLFSKARSEKEWKVTYEDVNEIVDRAIEISEGGLTWFRNGLPTHERVFFSALAEAQTRGKEPLELLQNHGVVITRQLRSANDQLRKWGFIKEIQQSTSLALPERSMPRTTFAITIELVRRWLIKSYPLKREIWELEKSDSYANSTNEKALVAQQNGNLQEALKLYDEVLTINPNHFSALFAIMEIYLDRKDAKVSTYYERAFRVDQVRAQSASLFAFPFPEFETDIFISYAHIDNLTFVESDEGWIDKLHQALEIRLSQIRGEKVKIWRDRKLQGNDYFSDAILGIFPSVKIFIPILSPRYVKSEWCLRELQAFYNEAEKMGGVNVFGKSRIFKVIKTPISIERQPQELRDLIGYDFFEIDDSSRPREFSDLFGEDSQRKYWAQLDDLANDINETLETLTTIPKDSKINLGKTIFLAQATPDLEDERSKVSRELKQRGYTVLPEQPLINIHQSQELESMVRKCLERSVLSVHLIGEQYRIPPKEEVQSNIATRLELLLTTIVTLQYRLALEQYQLASEAKRQDFSCLVWVPRELQIHELHQTAFFQELQDHPDFLQTGFEDLKELILERLSHSKPVLSVEDIPKDLPKLFLDLDEKDLVSPYIESLYDYLEQSFNVLLPDFEGHSLMASEDILRQCDAVLIYYGRASGLWLKRRLLALRKSLYNRSRPFLSKAIYIEHNRNQETQVFTEQELLVIRGKEIFSPRTLAPFLNQVRISKGG